jgi:hypothetical protein
VNGQGHGRKPLKCPCCAAGGEKPLVQDPTRIVAGGRLKEVTVHRRGQSVRRWAVWVTCRCGWSWWSANPTALEQAMKLERGRLARMPQAARSRQGGY